MKMRCRIQIKAKQPKHFNLINYHVLVLRTNQRLSILERYWCHTEGLCIQGTVSSLTNTDWGFSSPLSIGLADS